MNITYLNESVVIKHPEGKFVPFLFTGINFRMEQHGLPAFDRLQQAYRAEEMHLIITLDPFGTAAKPGTFTPSKFLTSIYPHITFIRHVSIKIVPVLSCLDSLGVYHSPTNRKTPTINMQWIWGISIAMNYYKYDYVVTLEDDMHPFDDAYLYHLSWLELAGKNDWISSVSPVSISGENCKEQEDISYLDTNLINLDYRTLPWMAGYTKFFAMSIVLSYLASSATIGSTRYDVFSSSAELNKRFNKYTVTPVSKRADGDNLKDNLKAFACCDHTYYKIRLPVNVTDAQVPQMLSIPSMGVYDRVEG